MRLKATNGATRISGAEMVRNTNEGGASQVQRASALPPSPGGSDSLSVVGQQPESQTPSQSLDSSQSTKLTLCHSTKARVPPGPLDNCATASSALGLSSYLCASPILVVCASPIIPSCACCVRGAANALVSSGLAKLGYVYFSIGEETPPCPGLAPLF